MKPIFLTVVTALVTACVAPVAWAAPADDDALRIASAHGCIACHQTETGAKGLNGAEAIGPAWRDVATRYKSVKGAQQQLTATVLTGSSPASAGASPYKNHWEGKVSGPFMPSHRSAIAEADAAQLVAWILALDTRR